MRNGSSAHDGDGWPSAQHPYRDDAMSGPGPYGPGRRSEPHEVPGGRREVPFGPDISWPNGFRQLDTEARRLLESGYGTSGYGRGQYDPGYGTGGRRSGYRSPDQSPSMDDYGDPGYSDPSYDGPRSASTRGWPGDQRGPRAPGGSPVSDGSGYGGVPGYRVPDYREPAWPDPGYQQGYAASDIYPVTGAQEALPDTGPQPIADSWPGRDPGSARSGRPAYADGAYADGAYADGAYADGPYTDRAQPDQGYPEQWRDRPRPDDARGSGARSDGSPAPDPRLEGMRYDELRYEEPLAGGPGYDEPLDDDAWVAELRRSAPAYPQPPAADQRRGDPRGDGHGQQQPGWGPPPGTNQPGSYPQASGYGQDRDDRGGPGSTPSRGPRMSAGPDTRPRPPAAPQDYLGAPTAQVGVLTAPAPAAAPSAASGASQVLAPVRPGHGLDGPEITSSWPAQPQTDDLESFGEFWAEDDNDAEYSGLFPGEDPDFDARREAGRTKRIGRRRGRSSDHRLWLALLGVVLAAGAAIFGILKFEFPAQSGPVHKIVAPARIGSYVRTVDMEKETKVNELREEVIKMSSGQASNVQSAVYESGNSAAGSTEQIVMFIGGHLANAAPASSIASFTQKFAGAAVVSPGSLGGQAACVEEAPGTSDSVAMCVWFDNDSFGEIVSPTMNATPLATVMRTMRPSLEQVIKN
jgi:hypothetical protein